MDSKYFLNQNEYSTLGALLWYNPICHFKKAIYTPLGLGVRCFHIVIGVAELLPVIGQIVSLFENVIAWVVYNSNKRQFQDQKIQKIEKINEDGFNEIDLLNNKIGFINTKVEVTEAFLFAKDKTQFLNDLLQNDPDKLHDFFSKWVKTLESKKKCIDEYKIMNQSTDSYKSRYAKIEFLKKNELKNEYELLRSDVLPDMAVFIFQNLSRLNKHSDKEPIFNVESLSAIKTILDVHHRIKRENNQVDFTAETFGNIIYKAFLSKAHSKDVESSAVNIKYFYELCGEQGIKILDIPDLNSYLKDEVEQDSVIFTLNVLLNLSQEVFNKEAPRIIEDYVSNNKESLKLIKWILENRNEEQLKVFRNREDLIPSYYYHSLIDLLLLKDHRDEFKFIRDEPKYRKLFAEFNEFDSHKTSSDTLSSLDKMLILVRGNKTALALSKNSYSILTEKLSSEFLNTIMRCRSLEKLVEDLFHPFSEGGCGTQTGYQRVILDLQHIGESNIDLLKKILTQPVLSVYVTDYSRSGNLWAGYPNGIQWLLNSKHHGYETGKNGVKKLLKLIYKKDRDFLIECCLAEDPNNGNLNVLSRLFLNENFNPERDSKVKILQGPSYYNSGWVDWFEGSLAKEVREERADEFFKLFAIEMLIKKWFNPIENKSPLIQLKNDLKEGKIDFKKYKSDKAALMSEIQSNFFKLMNELIILEIDKFENDSPTKNELIRKIRNGSVKTIIDNSVLMMENIQSRKAIMDENLEDLEKNTDYLDLLIDGLKDESNEKVIAFEKNLIQKYEKIKIKNPQDENLIQTLMERSFGANDLKNIQRTIFDLKSKKKVQFPLFPKLCEIRGGHLCLDGVDSKNVKNLVGVAYAKVKTISFSGMKGEWVSVAIKSLCNTFSELEAIEIHRNDLKTLIKPLSELIKEGKIQKIQIRFLDNPSSEKLMEEERFQDFEIIVDGEGYHFNQSILKRFGLFEEAKQWAELFKSDSEEIDLEKWNSFKNRAFLANQGMIQLTPSNLDEYSKSIDEDVFNPPLNSEQLSEFAAKPHDYLDKIDACFEENAALLFVKNPYFSKLFGDSFDGKFSLKDEEWFLSIADNSEALESIFTYLLENRIDVKTEAVAQELLIIANLWMDESLKNLLKLECARNGVDCNKYQLYSCQLKDEKTLKKVFGTIRESLNNKEFQSCKIQLLDLPCSYEILSETEREDYRKLADFKLDYNEFHSSLLKLFGLIDEYKNLELMNNDKKYEWGIFSSQYNLFKSEEFLRKYELAVTQGVIEITLKNIDSYEKWFEEGDFSLVDNKTDSSLSLEERYLNVPKGILFLKNGYFRNLLKDEGGKDFSITKEKWFIDNLESPQILEALLLYILENRYPGEEDYSTEVIEQVQKIVMEWEG
jgi:hypothetical protein